MRRSEREHDPVVTGLQRDLLEDGVASLHRHGVVVHHRRPSRHVLLETNEAPARRAVHVGMRDVLMQDRAPGSVPGVPVRGRVGELQDFKEVVRVHPLQSVLGGDLGRDGVADRQDVGHTNGGIPIKMIDKF